MGDKILKRDSFQILVSPVVSFGLRLSCNGVHDGVLWVHADWCVVLSVNNSGLSSWTPHFDGFVGGQGWVFQSYGIKAGGVLHAVRSQGGVGTGHRSGSERETQDAGGTGHDLITEVINPKHTKKRTNI